MSTRRRTIGSLAAVAALAVAGCGSDDGDGAASGASTTSTGAKATKKVNVAYASYGNTDSVQAEVAGRKKAVSPGGGSVKVFSADFDPQKQLKQCQDAITSGRYNASVLSPVDPAHGVPCIKAAEAAKVPVATIEQAVGPDPYSLKPQFAGVVAVGTIPLHTQGKAE